MQIRTLVSRYSRGIRRTVAVVLAAVVLSSVASPATASAKTIPNIHVVKPLGGDSPAMD